MGIGYIPPWLALMMGAMLLFTFVCRVIEWFWTGS